MPTCRPWTWPWRPPRRLLTRLAYRIADGKAVRLAEIARINHAFGRNTTARMGGQAETIERKVARPRRLGVDPEVVKMPVEDGMDEPRLWSHLAQPARPAGLGRRELNRHRFRLRKPWPG